MMNWVYLPAYITRIKMRICLLTHENEDAMEVKKIYFDMDGVLADFAGGVRELCGMEPVSQNAKNKDSSEEDRMWKAIKDAGHFYDKLEILPGAKEMFDALYGLYGDKCEILTGIPKPKRGIDSAGDDKTA